MGRLLISKPSNGKLNYQQTVSIAYDRQKDLYEIQYSDWDVIETKEEFRNAVLWVIHSPGTDLCRHFLEFLNWKADWR